MRRGGPRVGREALSLYGLGCLLAAAVTGRVFVGNSTYAKVSKHAKMMSTT